VLPSEGCDVRQHVVWNRRSLRPQLPDGPVEIDRVPVNDGGGDEAQARGTEALVSKVRSRISPWRWKNTARRSALLASPLFSPAWLC
jgi:hypothetical protein